MAKYSRFDPRNKKKNRHKNRYLETTRNQQVERRRNDESLEEYKELRLKHS